MVPGRTYVQPSVVVSMDVRDVRLGYRYRRMSMNVNVSVHCPANGSLYEVHRVAPYVPTYTHPSSLPPISFFPDLGSAFVTALVRMHNRGTSSLGR
jgi:hypothetical protein